MNDPIHEPDDPTLRARVRAALDSCEPRHPPPFERLWRSATAQPRSAPAIRATRRPALAALAIGAVAALAYAVIAMRTAPAPDATTADADYRLAREVSARFAAPSPFDALPGTVPPPVTRGLPVISDAREPLLPKEITL